MAGLASYRAKRDFAKTAEPEGRVAAPVEGHRFVVQKHAARRLHYDLRLELDGVLKSWAVTRGPSLVPDEKRLAVETEDHPLEYRDFEGNIPEGEYGAGTTIVWDRGTWKPLGDPRRGLDKGHLEFTLDGEKLHGRWHLVRMKGRPRETAVNWLLIKGEDAFARTDADADILEEAPASVLSGRIVDAVATDDPPAPKAAGGTRTAASRSKAQTERAAWSAERNAAAAPRPTAEPGGPIDPAAIPKARRGPLPDFVEPCLATLQGKAPTGPRWLHEIKFDGYRLEARIERGAVRLLTRSGLDWTEKFGRSVVEALGRLPADAAFLDGELVVEGPNGASDFSALQADLSAGRTDRFVYYAFDLLHLDGFDLAEARQIDRKEALARLLAGAGPGGPLRYSEHFEADGETMLRHACRLSLEGIVSKDRDRPYRGGRSKCWRKAKCAERQEFVIAGYVPSTVSRSAIGSLVLGTFEDGRFRHAGRVGTGFTARVAEDLMRRLEPIRRKDSPFAEKIAAADARGVVWVEPRLVAEVEYRGWTAGRSLRHASFRGLREDKPATEIVREAEPPAAEAPRPSAVKLTHPDRIYWPDAGVTKEGLADYYAEVWRLIAPHIVARPLSLLRCPGGIAETCFFQKHAWRGMNKAIRERVDPLDDKGEVILSIEDLDGLVALVQAGVLEIHPWGSSLADLEKPDRLVMDLDPHEGVPWGAMIEAVHEVRDRLAVAGLTSFLKTTGGKGLHVVAPLKPAAGWDAVKAFARGIADAMVRDAPARYVATATKAKRTDKIFVDYLRNGRGATAVAAYSPRARPGATVSTPLDWSELGEGVGPTDFTIRNILARLTAGHADPWAAFPKAARPLPERPE